MQNRIYRLNFVALILSTLGLSVCAGCHGYGESKAKHVQRDFDSKVWIASPSEERGSMVRSLLGLPSNTGKWDMSNVKLTEKSVLYNKSRGEIVEILGPPDGKGMVFVCYQLGYMGDKGYLKEEFSLCIDFDESERPSVIEVSR